MNHSPVFWLSTEVGYGMLIANDGAGKNVEKSCLTPCFEGLKFEREKLHTACLLTDIQTGYL